MVSPVARGALARFQEAFAHALLAPDAEPAADIAAIAGQPGFAVYRNTVMKGCIDALEANFPAVARLVGEEWFRATAAVYVRHCLPAEPGLLRYGASFPDFLARFEPAADLLYLPGVARLDYLWAESHFAPSHEALNPATVSRLTPEALADAILRPHPAARWAWFAEGPIYTIWSRNRAAASFDASLDWRPEGALLVRPHDVVEWIALDAAGCAFLNACSAGDSLGEAAHVVLQQHGDVDLAQLLAKLLEAGAFLELEVQQRPDLTEQRT